jgi:hypothetical protein
MTMLYSVMIQGRFRDTFRDALGAPSVAHGDISPQGGESRVWNTKKSRKPDDM